MQPDIANYLKSRRPPENVNLKHKAGFRPQDKMASLVTQALGSMYAVYFFITFVIAWILWQHTSGQPFDPYPYVFMIFISNIVQLLLIPLVMVGQNIQNKHAELRAEEEYRTTQTIHKDIETILLKLGSGK